MTRPRDPNIGNSETLPAAGDQSQDALYGPALPYGAAVGDYVVMARGARGGFATVYRAHRFDGEGDDVAIKVLHKMLVHSPNMIRRFEREGVAIQRVEHPNVVRLLEFGDLPDGRPYFVMPWIDGGDLREEFARRGVFSIAEVGELLEQLCGALSAAHGAGIVHRDVKTANIVVAPTPDRLVVKLVDFGVAKLAVGEGADHSLTSTGTRIGTPNYMAPEQVTSGPVDSRTDIYSLGVVVFELLTGRLPYLGPLALDVETQHLHAPIPRASELAPVPAAIDAVIARCLAKDPDDRFTSAPELWAAYRDAMTASLDHAIDGGGEIESATTRAIAVHARLVTTGDDTDALMDAVDAAIDAIEARLGLDLEIARVESSSVLAVVLLPDDDNDAAASRARVLRVALELGRGAWPGRLAITVHSAEVETGPDGGFVGGELLRVADWTIDDDIAAVVATADAFAGLADVFAHTTPTVTGLVRVLSPINDGA